MARGMRVNKINQTYQFVGNSSISGDNEQYILEAIEDYPVTKYEKVLDKLVKKKYRVFIANVIFATGIATLVKFRHRDNIRPPIVIVRFSRRAKPFFGKDIGVRLASGSESLKLQDFNVSPNEVLQGT